MGGKRAHSWFFTPSLVLPRQEQWHEGKLGCHCEQSEAILVSTEIASSLALLAMTNIC